MNQIIYKTKEEKKTVFVEDEGRFWLKELYGNQCNYSGRIIDSEPIFDIITIRTDDGPESSSKLVPEKVSYDKSGINMAICSKTGIFRVESKWTFCNDTGIWSRKDTFFNTFDKPLHILRYLAKFVFSPGQYEIYSQESKWIGENQGKWISDFGCDLVLKCEGGSTCNGNTPFLGLRKNGGSNGIAFHILPTGNWMIKIKKKPCILGSIRDGLPFLILEMGMSDECLNIKVSPGDSIELPEILIQSLPDREIHSGTSKLHTYINKNVFKGKVKTPVVPYNTWYDVNDALDLERLRKQLYTAREIGCEVFIMDAGWFGNGDGPWNLQTGDWTEKKSVFKGRMKDFADEVRNAGLDFGLWLEPEDIAPQAPILKSHPEWFEKASNNRFRPKLEIKPVYNYMLEEISGLIEKYGLAWIKVDFNLDFGLDLSESEYFYYYKSWFDIVDELGSRYPLLYIENCGAGCIRSDLNTSKHFYCNFLSDTPNPTYSLRILQGLLLRCTPGRIYKLITIRNIGNTVPEYGKSANSASESVITPVKSEWKPISITTTTDFAMKFGLLGIFGISTDINNLAQKDKDILKSHISFFKQWRDFIYSSIAHMLTPPALKEDNSGWAGIQLQKTGDERNLVYIYRLEDQSDVMVFYLKNLISDKEYRIYKSDEPGRIFLEATGESLMTEGFEVGLNEKYSSNIFYLL